MRTVLGGCMVVSVILAGVLAHAVEPLVLYDDFNATQLDAGKWVREEEGAGTEPSVQLQDNRLRPLPILRQSRCSYRDQGHPPGQGRWDHRLFQQLRGYPGLNIPRWAFLQCHHPDIR